MSDVLFESYFVDFFIRRFDTNLVLTGIENSFDLETASGMSATNEIDDGFKVE